MKAERFRQGLEDAIRTECMKYKDYCDGPTGWSTFESVIYALFEKYRIISNKTKKDGNTSI